MSEGVVVFRCESVVRQSSNRTVENFLVPKFLNLN